MYVQARKVQNVWPPQAMGTVCLPFSRGLPPSTLSSSPIKKRSQFVTTAFAPPVEDLVPFSEENVEDEQEMGNDDEKDMKEEDLALVPRPNAEAHRVDRNRDFLDCVQHQMKRFRVGSGALPQIRRGAGDHDDGRHSREGSLATRRDAGTCGMASRARWSGLRIHGTTRTRPYNCNDHPQVWEIENQVSGRRKESEISG